MADATNAKRIDTKMRSATSTRAPIANATKPPASPPSLGLLSPEAEAMTIPRGAPRQSATEPTMMRKRSIALPTTDGSRLRVEAHVCWREVLRPMTPCPMTCAMNPVMSRTAIEEASWGR